MVPGGQLVVLKEAVDYAEEESKARKTETENNYHWLMLGNPRPSGASSQLHVGPK